MKIKKNNSVYIPIGISCSVASYLRFIGLREYAFPFDWNVIPIQSAIELINNDFDSFLEKENLIFLNAENRLLFEEDGVSLKTTNELITPVYCKKYNMMFVHDFSEYGHNEFALVQAKYYRRIDRLKTLLNSNVKLIFVYDNVLPNEWQNNLYKEVKYNFKSLEYDKLQNLHISRLNIEILSLDELKKQTFFIRLFISIKKKMEKYFDFKKI